MPHPGNLRRPFAICRVLRNMKPAGPVVGQYMGEPVYGGVRDEWGRRYEFREIADFREVDIADLDLNHGEFVLHPGLVYRIEAGSSRWAALARILANSVRRRPDTAQSTRVWAYEAQSAVRAEEMS